MMRWLALLRPSQWVKNLMLLFPVFLGGGLMAPDLLPSLPLPLLSFSLVASATYIFNDLRDLDRDRQHPRKKNRPLAAGTVTTHFAILAMGACLMTGLFLGGMVSSEFFLILGLYLILSFAYSTILKHIVLVDIFCIAGGFLLRLEAGGVAFNVTISEWLFLSVFLLSLFLGTGKRLHEKLQLGQQAAAHRQVLLAYPDGFLDGAMYLTGGTVLVTYSMYVLNHQGLIYTVPLCCYGLLRFILRVKTGQGGDPTDSLMRDPHLFVISLTWALIMAWTIYG